MKLLIEVYGQLLSMDFAAIDALKTAITKAMDTPPRAKVAEASVVGIIQARFLGLCLVIKAANQQITIQAEDVPILQAALTNAGPVLNVPSTTETPTGDIVVMCYAPLEEISPP